MIPAERATAAGLVVEAAGERRVAVLFATAAPVHDVNGPCALDMGGCDLTLLNSGRAPLLADHGAYLGGVLGVIETAWIVGERAFALARFARTGAAEDAWQMVRDGIVRNVSLGLAYALADAEPLRGGAARILRRWRPYEVSLVALPKDWGAVVLPDGMGEAEHRAALATVGEHRSQRARQASAEVFATFAAPGLAAALGGTTAQAEAALMAEAARFGGEACGSTT